MTDYESRLVSHDGKWHVIVRNTATGTANAVWISLGGCTDQLTAIRIWLACQGKGKR